MTTQLQRTSPNERNKSIQEVFEESLTTVFCEFVVAGTDSWSLQYKDKSFNHVRLTLSWVMGAKALKMEPHELLKEVLLRYKKVDHDDYIFRRCSGTNFEQSLTRIFREFVVAGTDGWSLKCKDKNYTQVRQTLSLVMGVKAFAVEPNELLKEVLLRYKKINFDDYIFRRYLGADTAF